MKTYDFGIDLGTSNSSISFAKDGRVVLIPDTTPPYTSVVPSAVMRNKDGSMVVGRLASHQSWRPHGQVALRFKRALGTTYRHSFPNCTESWSPEQLSAQVLKELIRIASAKGHTVDRAVVCTPAKFQSVQVEATRKAAQLAGLDQVEFLSEPMAASYGYGFTSERKGSWLIFDIGAGTFDAVVMQNDSGKLRPLDIDGANQLGGSDMDRLIWDSLIVPRIANEIGIKTENPIFLKIRPSGLHHAEALKLQLSSLEVVNFDSQDLKQRLEIDGEEVSVSFDIHRNELNKLLEPLVHDAIRISNALIQKYPKISAVLPIGGPMNMPIFQYAVRSLGVEVLKDVDPMTAVATGAALYASITSVRGARSANPSAQPSGFGPVRISLEYEPASEDSEAPLIISGSDPRAAEVEVVREPNFSSGRLPLDGQPHPLLVPLLPRQNNIFRIKVYSPRMEILPSDPEEFSIYSGLTVGAPPLPESFRVEVQKPEDEGYTTHVIVARGTPLPAKGTVVLKTTESLSKAEGGKFTVKIWEGDREHARSNLLAFLLTVDASALRTRLPAKSEVEITLKISSSRQSEAEVYIPILDQTIPVPTSGQLLETNNPAQIEDKRQWLVGKIDQLESELDPKDPARRDLRVQRERLFSNESTIALRLAREGGPDSGDAIKRLDTLLRDCNERYLLALEKNELSILPKEWKQSCEQAEALLQALKAESGLISEFNAIRATGDTALATGKRGKLRNSLRQLRSILFAILSQDVAFWKHLLERFSNDPYAYREPAKAAQLLQIANRSVKLEEVRDAVRALHRLRVVGASDGDVLEDPDLTF